MPQSDDPTATNSLAPGTASPSELYLLDEGHRQQILPFSETLSTTGDRRDASRVRKLVSIRVRWRGRTGHRSCGKLGKLQWIYQRRESRAIPVLGGNRVNRVYHGGLVLSKEVFIERVCKRGVILFGNCPGKGNLGLLPPSSRLVKMRVAYGG
ncbi:hypothetical protein JB92DRAFT_2833637 [Gautieria morchelliformis]|nr:hypothetical protein JB92DRAFT_2833637 [Gautieria morchelliformis]